MSDAKPTEQTTVTWWPPDRPNPVQGAIITERERCRRIVVDILSEEGWVGQSFERIVEAIKNGT